MIPQSLRLRLWPIFYASRPAKHCYPVLVDAKRLCYKGSYLRLLSRDEYQAFRSGLISADLSGMALVGRLPNLPEIEPFRLPLV